MTARAGTGVLWIVLALALAAGGCGSDTGATATTNTAGDGTGTTAMSGATATTGAATSGSTATTTTGGGSAPPVTGPTLVAAGDIACPPGERRTRFTCHQPETAVLAERQHPDVVATLGDLQYPSGSLADFRASFAHSWGRFKTRIRPAPGNHEFETPAAAGYFGYFGRQAAAPGKGWYSYDLGGWHVVALNANCDDVDCSAGSPQQRWLQADLAAHPARCTLAYWHQARFSSGLHGSDAALIPLWSTLQRAGADVVLSGHDHDYERFAPQTADGRLDPAHGIAEFVVGTGGKSLYPIVFPRRNSRARASTFGVLRLTLGSDGYAWRFVGEPGERFRDAGSARCV